MQQNSFSGPSAPGAALTEALQLRSCRARSPGLCSGHTLTCSLLRVPGQLVNTSHITHHHTSHITHGLGTRARGGGARGCPANTRGAALELPGDPRVIPGRERNGKELSCSQRKQRGTAVSCLLRGRVGRNAGDESCRLTCTASRGGGMCHTTGRALLRC